MAIKTILVNASEPDGFPRVLSSAVDLASRHQAHLIGMAVLAPTLLLPAGVPGVSDLVALSSHREASIRAAATMQERFLDATRSLGANCEWVVEDAALATATAIAARRAMVADLVVACLPDVRWSEFGPTDVSDQLITECGRPVLLVPKSTISRPLGHCVVVAWNGSREAARATFDAIPLLAAAAQVTLLSVCEDPASRRNSAQSAARIRQALANHGVRAKLEEIQIGRSHAGPALLSESKAHNADLLVMGCYGHSRLSEFVLGGATRHVLQNASIPVLMSH